MSGSNQAKSSSDWFKQWPPEVRRDFIENYHAIFEHFAQRHGLTATDAADTSQEALFRIHKLAPRYDHTKAVWPWVKRIVLNVLREQRRRRRNRISKSKSLSSNSGELDQFWDEALRGRLQERGDASVIPTHAHLVEMLKRLLASVPELERKAMQMMLEGESLSTIARALNENRSTLDRHLATAYMALRQRLEILAAQDFKLDLEIAPYSREPDPAEVAPHRRRQKARTKVSKLCSKPPHRL